MYRSTGVIERSHDHRLLVLINQHDRFYRDFLLQEDQKALPTPNSIIKALASHERWYVIALIVGVFLGGSALRAAFIDAEFDISLTQSSERITDEGWRSANALNKVLTGRWLCEQHNWITTLPVPQLMQWIAFEVFGISLKTARIPSMILSLLAIGSAILLILSNHPWKRGPLWCGLLFAYLLSSNYLFFNFSRMVFYEIPMIGFGTAAILSVSILMNRYQNKKKYLTCAFATTAFLILSMLSKTTGVVFVLAIGIAVFTESYFEKRFDIRLLLIVIGVGTAAVIVTYFTPTLVGELIGASKKGGLKNVVLANIPAIDAIYYYRFFYNEVFRTAPVIHAASVFGCLLVLVQSSRNQKISRADALMLALYISVFFVQGAFEHQPPRYALPLVIPMCYFAAVLPFKVVTDAAIFGHRRLTGFLLGSAVVILMIWGNTPNIEKLHQYFANLSFSQVTVAKEIRHAILVDSGSTQPSIYGNFPSTFVLENGMFFHFGEGLSEKKRPLYLILLSTKPPRSEGITELGTWDIVKPYKNKHIRLYRID